MKQGVMTAVLSGTLAVVGWSGRAGAQDSAEKGPREAAINAEEEKQALEFIKSHAPEMHQNLEIAKTTRPEEYQRHLREILPMYRDPDVRQVFVRTMKAETRARKLTESLRHADAAGKDGLKKELESALAEQFDAKLSQQELQLKKVQAELGRLKARIEKRRSLKDKLVKKRLGELMGDEDDGLEW